MIVALLPHQREKKKRSAWVQAFVRHSSTAVQRSILQSRGHRHGPTVSVSKWFNFPVNKISHQHQSQYHHRSAICRRPSHVPSFALTKRRQQLITEKMMLDVSSLVQLLTWTTCRMRVQFCKFFIFYRFLMLSSNLGKIISNLSNSICKVILQIHVSNDGS